MTVSRSQPSIVERLRAADPRKCPWDTDAGEKISPDAACPVCGDFGNDAALGQPSNCIATGNNLLLSEAAARIEELTSSLDRATKALDHARVRFLCIADEAEEAGDEAAWAMAAVDADRMILALAALNPNGAS